MPGSMSNGSGLNGGSYPRVSFLHSQPKGLGPEYAAADDQSRNLENPSSGRNSTSGVDGENGGAPEGTRRSAGQPRRDKDWDTDDAR